MTDEAGAAPAAAEPISAPEATIEAPVSTPNPVQSEAAPEPVKAEAEPKKSVSIDEALDRATKKVESDLKTEKSAEKPVEAKTEVKRDETGKFATDKPAEKAVETVEAKPAVVDAPKAKTPHSDPPTRFSPDAKAAWETAPDPVKAEVHRAIRELEEGHQKYKASAESYEQVRQFDEIARQNGGNLKASLEKIVDMENTFARDPIAGFQKVADHYGLSLREVAAHIMGQKPEDVQFQQDSTIRELKNELAQLKQQIGGVTKTFEEQRTTQTLAQVQEFAKAHPRFDELTADIEFFLTSGRTKDLGEAYQLAERLNPAPAEQVIPAASSAPALAIVAQTDKGTKSISGAPSAGSNPVLRKASKTIDESLDRAFAKLG